MCVRSPPPLPPPRRAFFGRDGTAAVPPAVRLSHRLVAVGCCSGCSAGSADCGMPRRCGMDNVGLCCVGGGVGVSD